jgi:hypothetical protein
MDKEVSGPGTELGLHPFQGRNQDPSHHPTPPGMNDTHALTRGVHQEHRHTVPADNAEENPRLVRKMPISVGGDPEATAGAPALTSVKVNPPPVDLTGVGHLFESHFTGQSLPCLGVPLPRTLREQAEVPGLV